MAKDWNGAAVCLGIALAGTYWLVGGYMRLNALDERFDKEGQDVTVVHMNSASMRRTRSRMFSSVEASFNAEVQFPDGSQREVSMPVTYDTYYEIASTFNKTDGTPYPGKSFRLRYLPGNPEQFRAGSERMVHFATSLWWMILVLPFFYQGLALLFH
jgi:hypothetical protein